MNRTLVVCMLVSGAAGASAAAGAIVAGWGVLAALGLYSAAGSIALVLTALLAASIPPSAKPAKARADRPKETAAFA